MGESFVNSIKATPYSNLKIFHHPDILKRLEKGERTVPLYIRIKPTNKCNQNCYYCHYRNSYLTLDEYNPTDYIPQDKMLEIVSDMQAMGVKAVTFSGGGEPLIYPYINEAMEKILNAGIDLSIITNGTMLKGKSAELLAKAKWVRISIDSSNDELYSSMRSVPKGMFNDLCENIKKFSQIKSMKCELGINFVVNKENHTCVFDIAELMRSLGVNHIKFTPAMSNQAEEYHRPFKNQVIEEISRAKKQLENDQFRIIDLYTSDFKRLEDGTMFFDRAYTKCFIKEFICVIAANSKVYFCHDKAYLKNGLVGDLKQVSFKKLWFSDEVDKKFMNFNAQCICNEHCVYDDRNILLNSFFSLDKNHINFI